MERTLGEKLAELRKSRGLTQHQVAQQLKITAAAVSAYERDANQPSLAILKKFTELYRVSADFLLGIDTRSSQEWVRKGEELICRLQLFTQDFSQYIKYY